MGAADIEGQAQQLYDAGDLAGAAQKLENASDARVSEGDPLKGAGDSWDAAQLWKQVAKDKAKAKDMIGTAEAHLRAATDFRFAAARFEESAAAHRDEAKRLADMAEKYEKVSDSPKGKADAGLAAAADDIASGYWAHSRMESERANADDDEASAMRGRASRQYDLARRAFLDAGARQQAEDAHQQDDEQWQLSKDAGTRAAADQGRAEKAESEAREARRHDPR